MTVSLESQWNVDFNDVWSIWKYYQLLMHESNTFLLKTMPLKPLGQLGQTMLKSTPPHKARGPPSSIWMPKLTLLTILNDIRIQSDVLLQYTLRTDRPTDRQTDAPGDFKWYSMLHSSSAIAKRPLVAVLVLWLVQVVLEHHVIGLQCSLHANYVQKYGGESNGKDESSSDE